MPIVSADIQYRLSGGAANANVNASLGGAKSSTVMTQGTVGNLFDTISSAETAAGDVEYRCIYVHNNHGTLTLQNAVLWVTANTPDANTDAAVALGSSAVGGTEQTIADEGTAPTGVTFSAPTTKGTGLAIGNIPAGSHKAIWLRRTVTAGMAATNDDGVQFRVEGDTAA